MGKYLLKQFGEDVRRFRVTTSWLCVMQQQTDEFFAETIRHLLDRVIHWWAIFNIKNSGRLSSRGVEGPENLQFWQVDNGRRDCIVQPHSSGFNRVIRVAVQRTSRTNKFSWEPFVIRCLYVQQRIRRPIAVICVLFDWNQNWNCFSEDEPCGVKGN